MLPCRGAALIANARRTGEITMAHKVTDACVGCGACEGACPVGAVKVGDEGKAVVDAGACIDCGACEGVCPTGAIIPE